MKPRSLLFVFIAVIVVAIAGYLLRAKLFPAEAPRYISQVVKTGTVSETVLASGVIKPAKLVAVGAQVSGRITSLKVKLGDDVKQNDLIAEIDSRTEENALKTSEAGLAYVEAQLREKTASLTLAQLTLARQQSIYNQKAGPRSDFETAEASVKTTQAQIDALKAQADQAKVAVDTARANLSYTKITAPMDGTVLAVVNQEGRTVNAAQSAPTIVILGDLDTMAVRAEISEADIVRVKPGQKVYYSILGEPETLYETSLASIEPAPESITSDSAVAASSTSSSSGSSSSAIYYVGVFNIDNKARKFRTYMTADIKIVLGEARDVLTISSSALGAKNSDGSYTVQVIGADGKTQPRNVMIGLNNKTSAEVKSGLEKGERVVIGQASTSSSSSPGGRPRRPMGL
jgi:membrane fusion protein, macrolide-specific efflux system